MKLSEVELLFGHTSADTALSVDNYPYGRTIRTTIRYWLETTKYGDRMCSQTVNPRTGRWNKPKKSTYSRVGVMYREPDTGYIRWHGLGDWPGAEAIAEFCAEVGNERLNPSQRHQLAELIGYERAFKDVTFKIVRGDEVTPESEAEQQKIHAVINHRVRVETVGALRQLEGS